MEPLDGLARTLHHLAGRTRRKMRKPVPLGMVLLLVLAAAVAGAATVSTTQTSLASIFGEVSTVSTDLTTSTNGIGVVSTSLTAVGDTSAGAVEMVAALGTAQTNGTIGNWQYSVDVQESAVDAVASGTFQVELFIDGTSQGALYMTQGTADDLSTEGVTFTWDIGSDLTTGGQSYVVKVTAV